MVTIENIYAQTRGGLDIILYYYPQASDCVDNKKKFKARDEDDASACIKSFKTDQGDVYKVTDFGADSRAMSPLDICMLHENVGVADAVKLLASRYNVVGENNFTLNRPEIRKRPATTEEEEGKKYLEFGEGWSTYYLSILGPRVEEKHCKELNWHTVKSITHIKNREAIVKSSTDHYPILARECVVENTKGEIVDKFYKLYEPMNIDKQWRFSYTPDGVKPPKYINGLYELKKAYKAYNKSEEDAWCADPNNEGKPYRAKKLPEAFICSGERDALCVKSLGYYPLWFNSETYRLSDGEYKEIMKYVDRLYNIPDIDATGVKKGSELALQFMEIYTIWLPQKLMQGRDIRGKAKKDLRDWMEDNKRYEDFRNLIKLAMPARFWVAKTSEKRGKPSTSYEIDTVCLHHFLQLNGFYSLRDEKSDRVQYIHINGHVVRKVKTKDVRAFLKNYAKEKFLEHEVRNLILNSTRLSDSSLENLDEIDLNFKSHTPREQRYFFPDCVWTINGEGIRVQKKHEYDGSCFVWEENIIDHRVKLSDEDYFRITRTRLDHGVDFWDIDIKPGHGSCMLDYLINTSRVHWRKELETSLDDLDEEEAEEYRKQHKFDIAGKNLTEEERAEQKQNLVNKIFTIGYMLHRYKSPSRAWAPYAMDNKIGDDCDESNGRSGKSFLFKSFDFFMKTVKLSGRNSKLMDNAHVFDQVNQYTDFLLIDDCDKSMGVGLFYDIITSDMTVNPKNNQSFNIPFSESPKIGFTTNFVPKEFDPSTEGRLLYIVFSDYYHQQAEGNDYHETRTIRDDFGKNLQTDYTEQEWNADINFFMQCLRFYLSLADEGVKILPPMKNIIARNLKQVMGANFNEWAESYFSQGTGNVNNFIVREYAFNDYKMATGISKITPNSFKKKLEAFAKYKGYELNPKEYQNSSGRIARFINNKSEIMIYMRTKEEQQHTDVKTQMSLDGFTDTQTEASTLF